MTLPAATKNNMLDGQDFDSVSLHTDFPGTTGANEASGGTYARQSMTLPAAVAGQRLFSSTLTFPVEAGIYKWVGLWNGSTFAGTVPNGGSLPKNFMAIPSTDRVWSTAHGFSDGAKITFYQGTPPGPLVEGTTYFVRDSDTDSFKVAATSGGSAINLVSSATAGCWMSGIVEQEHSAPGTHLVTSFTEVLPD